MSVTTSTFILRYSGANTDNAIIEVPFYPPDTISGKNVFMKMVCSATNGYEFGATSLVEGSTFLVSCLDLPQPVGTISDTLTNDCQRSNALGIITFVSDRSPFYQAPLILTYIPDGLRTLRFRIETLNNTGDSAYKNCIQDKMMITLLIQFEVSGTR